MNRIADLFGRSRWGWTITLIVVNVAFGLAHSYQDVTGIVEAGIAGLYSACCIWPVAAT